jgi:hypothetical protein
MRYIKDWKLFESAEVTPESLGISDYTVNADGSIDVSGDVNLSNRNLTRIPIKFRDVSGNFSCYRNNLTSLEFAPQSVGGDFSCSRNNLTSLEFAPQSVGGDFYCYMNNLTSLEFAPQSVGGDFYCDVNQLTSLEFAPLSVRGGFSCYGNNLTSLEFAPIRVKWLNFSDNSKIYSLDGAPKFIYRVNYWGTPLEGILNYIMGLRNWDISQWELLVFYNPFSKRGISLPHLNDFLEDIGEETLEGPKAEEISGLKIIEL